MTVLCGLLSAVLLSARRSLWLTSKQVGRPVAWVRDGRIIAVATLTDPIGDGLVLTGIGAGEARMIHAQLTAGTGPAGR